MTKSIAIKLDRAKKHLENLQQKIQSHMVHHPLRVEKEQESETGDIVHRVRITEPTPEHWSADIGDVIHNLRSALDHLACELVTSNRGTITRYTAFPISTNPTKFNEHMENVLKGASVAAMSAVQKIAPYKGGNDDIWRIHRLDIIDKHQNIVAVGTIYKNLILKLTTSLEGQHPIDIPAVALNPSERQYPLQDGQEVFREKAAVRNTQQWNFIANYGFHFVVAFGENGIVSGEPLIETLQRFVNGVEQVVNTICAELNLP